MGASYEELLGISAERFLSIKNVGYRPENMDPATMCRVALLMSDYDAQTEVRSADAQPYTKQTYIDMMGRRGITHVARMVALRDTYEEGDKLRFLPWTGGHHTHGSLLDDLFRVAAIKKFDQNGIIEKTFLHGYALSQDGTSYVVYDAVNRDISVSDRQMLKDASAHIPDVTHVAKLQYDEAAIPVDSL